MDSKLLKNFTPFINLDYKPQVDIADSMLANLDLHAVHEPALSAWGSVGFAEVAESEFAIDIQGAGWLCAVQFNEKILPGPTLREKTAERIAKIEQQDGRKASKKVWAQVKDEVALDLLPKAFIRRKIVPVIFHKNMVLVFTSSAKKCDEVIALLAHALASTDSFKPVRMVELVKDEPIAMLTKLAKDGEINFNKVITSFTTDDTAVLKGKGKQTIRIKDKDIASDDVQRLLKQDYIVTQLGVDLWLGDSKDPDASLIINDQFTCTRLSLAEVKHLHDDQPDETMNLIADAWAVATMAGHVVRLLIDIMGGIHEPKRVTAADIDQDLVDLDDDDEL